MVIAPRYLERFRCLGGDCPDTCCAAMWEVGVDRASFVTIERLLATSGEGAGACMRERPPEQRSDEEWAFVARRADGRCQLLDEDSTCRVHARHGEAALPTVCSMYPRRAARVGDRTH